MNSRAPGSVVATTSIDPQRRAALASLVTAGTATVCDIVPQDLDGVDVLVIDAVGDMRSDAWPDGTSGGGATGSAIVGDGTGNGDAPGGSTSGAAALAARLSAWVGEGGRLLVVGAPPTDQGWTALTGVVAHNALPVAEYVLTPDGSSLTERVDDEIQVVDALIPLELCDATSVLCATVGTRALTAVSQRCSGKGSVAVAGVTGSHGALHRSSIATVLARTLRPTPTRRRTLGVGILGYGAFGHRHGSASQATAGLTLAAVADPDADRRHEAAASFPNAAMYTDATALLADDDVDLVIISTPPVSHADLAADALRSGRHVVVEKPLCLTRADADRLIQIADGHDRVLTVHQNRRWDPDFLAIQRVVDDGLLGDVFNVETFVGAFEHPCRAWHSEVSVSGGAVYDWGAHHLDWTQRLLGGFPSRVQTTRHKRVWHDVTNADQLRVRLRWDDGREAEFVDSMLAAVRRPKFYIQGTRGTLVGHYRPVRTERVDPRDGYLAIDHHHAEAPADLLLARHEPGLGISETRLALPAPPPHAFHRNLADHLLLGEPLAVTAEQARRTVILLEAAHRSGMEGGTEVRVAA